MLKIAYSMVNMNSDHHPPTTCFQGECVVQLPGFVEMFASFVWPVQTIGPG